MSCSTAQVSCICIVGMLHRVLACTPESLRHAALTGAVLYRKYLAQMSQHNRMQCIDLWMIMCVHVTVT